MSRWGREGNTRGHRPEGQHYPLILVPPPTGGGVCEEMNLQSRDRDSSMLVIHPHFLNIPTGQINLRPRRKSSTNLQPPLLLLQNLITLLPAPGPRASVALVPCTRLHTPGTSFPSYVTSTALDWVADAEIRPRRGKPPKPGSYTAWFPRQPSHRRQTVQRGVGVEGTTPVQGAARAGSDLSFLVGETSLSKSPRAVLPPKNFGGSQFEMQIQDTTPITSTTDSQPNRSNRTNQNLHF